MIKQKALLLFTIITTCLSHLCNMNLKNDMENSQHI